ncbi:MAG: hypothetical protein GQF41_0477 [Candidatus Rifleibacterium amylolyticum]|nr:MAG: hypothetical protein GQF41_0477 [Candidatus Rifleibacterium amylolyticum]
MICKLCDQTKALIKAHCIPKAFFVTLKDDVKEPLLIVKKGDKHTKRSQIGVYDKKILCSECEKVFQEWDDYGQKILIKERGKAQKLMVGSFPVLKFENVDYAKLKMFVISVFWRAGISNEPYYEKITLGPFEQKLRNMIKNADPGEPEDFSFLLFCLKETNPKVAVSPQFAVYDRVNYVVFFLDKYILRIKSDSRSSPRCFQHLTFQPGDDLYVPQRDLFREINKKEVVKMVKSTTGQGL